MEHGWLVREERQGEIECLTLLLLWIRFFFHLKGVSFFGPFIKIISMNCWHLLSWLFSFIITILVSTQFLITLLSQKLTSEDGCANFKQCLFLLVEGSLGEVNFSAMAQDVAAEFSYSALVIIFMVLFMSVLIAQMTNTYKNIVKRGVLFYEKEIFDLRYYYYLDDRFGALVVLDFPVSVPLSLLVIPFFILSKLKKSKFLAAEASKDMEEISPTPSIVKTHICCCCCGTRKHNPHTKFIDLEDFNELVLRLAHALFILVTSALAFLLGVLLLPFGYLALVINETRLICKRKHVSRSYMT